MERALFAFFQMNHFSQKFLNLAQKKVFKQKKGFESLQKKSKDAFETFFESNFSKIHSTEIFRALMNPSERKERLEQNPDNELN